MIVVTGAAGFIGSNLVAGLNARGESNILAVDDLRDGRKALNLSDLEFADYMAFDSFEAALAENADLGIGVIFHQGACSETTEWDGRYMMANNYSYSKTLLNYCQGRNIPLIYASSASVYGAGPIFGESRANEQPLNMYAFSKFAFDQHVRSRMSELTSPVAGLRYFNVYGPREQHKDGMASVARHFHQQIMESGECHLFEGCDGYADGEQRRDFVHVDDCVDVNLWLWDHSVTGIFNCGTGRSQTFNEVANAVIAWHGSGKINYKSFPQALVGRYQSFTEADMSSLRNAGYSRSFYSVEEGVPLYLDWLSNKC